MKIDAILPSGIVEADEAAAQYEAIGFDGLWALETQSDPFLDLAPIALRRTAPLIGTNVAIAFARSPFLTAMDAWRLQAASQGRFVLGLGSEVKGHVERRFGMPWEAPGPKLREYAEAVRAIWRAFQREERLNFKGKYYQHTLLIPYFDPGRIAFAPPPIYIAAVNTYNAETVGLVGDGIMIHPMHSMRYLNDVLFPAMDRGLRQSGRSRADISVVCSVFVIAGDEQERKAAEAEVRNLIAFQGAVRTYAKVFETHGWDDLPQQFHDLMASRDMGSMLALVTDDMIDAFAVRGRTDEEAVDKIVERYQGVADRIAIFNLNSCSFAEDPERLRNVVTGVRKRTEPVTA